jgi:hypothetical protein
MMMIIIIMMGMVATTTTGFQVDSFHSGRCAAGAPRQRGSGVIAPA